MQGSVAEPATVSSLTWSLHTKRNHVRLHVRLHVCKHARAGTEQIIDTYIYNIYFYRVAPLQ